MTRPYVWLHLRRTMVRGLIAVLPALITVWLLRILFDFVHRRVTPVVVAMFQALGFSDVDRWEARFGFPALGVALTVLLVYAIGLVAGNLAGRKLLALFERLMLRVPLVRTIYGSAKQLIDAFGASGTQAFSKVVIVEYPRKGMWTIGFVSRKTLHRLPSGERSEPMVPVFLPTTPNPTSGWLVLARTCEVLVVDISVEAALKLIVSGGIAGPGDLGPAVRPWGPADGPAAAGDDGV